jgi:hypothetical protein
MAGRIFPSADDVIIRTWKNLSMSRWRLHPLWIGLSMCSDCTCSWKQLFVKATARSGCTAHTWKCHSDRTCKSFL